MKTSKRPTRILFIQDRRFIPAINLEQYRIHKLVFDSISSPCGLYEFVRRHDFDIIGFNLFHATKEDKESLLRLKEEGMPHPILFFYQEAEDLIFFNDVRTTEDDLVKFPLMTDELDFKISKMKKVVHEPEFNLRIGPFIIDSKARLIHYMNQFKKLGRRELQIFQLLAHKKDEVVSRENILEHLYHQVDLYDRTIDSHISHLRKKLWELAGPTLQIISVYGYGYRIQIQET